MCEWVVQTNPISVIEINVIDVNIEYSNNCIKDSIEIMDGFDSESQLLQKICTSDVHMTLTSSGPNIFIRFISDNDQTAKGFHFAFRTRKKDRCGGILKGPSGSVSFPVDPLNRHDVDCIWLIVVDPGNIISLTFDRFSLEASSTDGCHYDYLSIFADKEMKVPLTENNRYCGGKMPPNVRSFSNIMLLRLHTDERDESAGFSARYFAIPADETCGGYLREPVGVIVSPNYPGRYPDSYHCVWTIVMEFGKQIHLNITSLDMEEDVDCISDYLEIRDGSATDSPLIGKICRLPEENFISTGNKLLLIFQSDMKYNGNGFKIIYDGTITGTRTGIANVLIRCFVIFINWFHAQIH
ncbi:hypothetical protein HELRODRAFT_97359, partial [Helobdella robusta]|uniref:CUB domain-containing protein n=1 Tax=Helobdella robusta TaxID=6412 RepID=T1G9G5_HELRO